jgi:TetR/AcrR family tetracycline transcriptional repressor
MRTPFAGGRVDTPMALDRGEIVKAALALLDEAGFEAVSTRALAARLGVRGPSLYWHFKSMRELFDHMAEAMLEETLPSHDRSISPGDWRTWLAQGARGVRQAALSRRDGARILAGAKLSGTGKLNFPRMIARLEADGFNQADARAALMALGRYALGWVLDEQIARGATVATEADFEFGLQAMLTGLEAHLLPNAGGLGIKSK